VFSNPVKILQWILPQIAELNRVLFLCLSAHLLNALLAEFYRTPQSFLFLLNSQQGSFVYSLAMAQCPPGRALQNSQEFMSATVFSSIAFPPELFNNLEILL
jgi:hypothetical protein